MSKISIIGAGAIGATTAFALLQKGIAREIVINDINQEKALGEVMDLMHGSSLCRPCNITLGSIEDTANSDIIIITAGLPQKPGETRLDLVDKNYEIFKSFIPKLAKLSPNSILLVVSNPVDVLSYMSYKLSGFPKERVIGSGTVLDTARLRSLLGKYFEIDGRNVEGYVLGEHGDTAVVPWSIANISNVPVEDYGKSLMNNDGFYPEFKKNEVEDFVRKSGGRVIRRKGATYYAVSMSVCHLCKCLLSGIDTSLTVSTMVHGEYGLHDVALSLVNVVGKNGIHGKIMVPLTDAEIADLHKSADSLKAVINSIEI